MEVIDSETFEKVRKYAMGAEKISRFEHSMRVAETAHRMCEIYGENGEKAYFAGMAHDICKDLDDEVQLSLASRDGNPISEMERKKPSLLHGRAAAVLLRRDFGVQDEEILQAIARHTFGGADLCPLAKIIFAADKIEPGRPQSSKEYLERLFSMSLNRLVLAVVEENIRYLTSNGWTVAEETYNFRKWLLENADK